MPNPADLAQAAADAVKRLDKGQGVPLVQVARELGVCEVTTRRRLKRAAAMGLVRAVRRKGWTVVEPKSSGAVTRRA